MGRRPGPNPVVVSPAWGWIVDYSKGRMNPAKLPKKRVLPAFQAESTPGNWPTDS